MAVEKRGFKTDRGVLIPYYKVPYTASEWDNLQTTAWDGDDPRSAMIYEYSVSPQDTAFLPEPHLGNIRVMVDDIAAGGNIIDALGLLSGVFKFTTGGVVEDFNKITYSPTTSEWIEKYNIEYQKINGTIKPKEFGNDGVESGGNIAKYRPVRKDGIVNASAFDKFPRCIVMTSDFKLKTLTIGPLINVIEGTAYCMQLGNRGMENVYYRSDDPSFWANVDSEHIATLEYEEEGEDPDMARFNPRAKGTTVGMYLLSADDMKQVMKDLWSTSLMETIQSNFIGDGSDAILGLNWFYGLDPYIEKSALSYNPTLGNVLVDGVSVKHAEKEFVRFDFGSINVPAVFGSHLDYTAAVYKMYLPFIGITDLNPADVVGKTLYLSYVVNLSDGSAICRLATDANAMSGNGTLFTSSCSWGYSIPVKVDSVRDAMTIGAQAVMGVVGGVSMGAMAGPAGAIAGGAAGAAGGAVFSSAPNYSGGSLSPNSNAMGDFEAKLIVYRNQDMSEQLEESSGTPSGSAGEVSDFTGYLKVDAVYNGSTLAMRRSGEIVAMLQEGIYI